ncbi:D-Ala-D-Ala carboxypeptidase family metallohydrolase [Thaumasiovibrio sp. DFM-14]|uniref:D-Ala-D-Ala carboxypeptidase family metallohydrolase n=1 Tax=Thaumasiovibrio sp. DFM-14 TaxID=3384792 RepID=UPI0039A3CC8D
MLVPIITGRAADLSALYEDTHNVRYTDLLVNVQGFQVPTLTAFRGWVIMNDLETEVEQIYQFFDQQGVDEMLPWHLVMMQGTDWARSGKTVFNLPQRKNWANMARTLRFIQKHVIPEVGPVIPVSGDRSQEYNVIAGGAKASKHLTFCALDLVPVNAISRAELHQKLKEIYRLQGRESQMGLGLYAGVRFHIDTCGYRQW